jgi:hypothetical protein
MSCRLFIVGASAYPRNHCSDPSSPPITLGFFLFVIPNPLLGVDGFMPHGNCLLWDAVGDRWIDHGRAAAEETENNKGERQPSDRLGLRRSRRRWRSNRNGGISTGSYREHFVTS